LRGDEKYKQRLQGQVENEKIDLPSSSAGENGPLEALVFDLEVKPYDSPNSERYKIGKFAILVPAHADEMSRPILGRNQMHFRAVAARTTSAILGVTMEFLNSVIQEFGVRINNTQSMSAEEWFAEIKTTAANAGLIWIVAEIVGEKLLLGESEAVQDMRRLQSQNGKENGRYLRSTSLALSKGNLYIGVRGGSYYDNQNVCHLWKSFFLQFAQMADSALQRIISNEEKNLLEYQAAQSFEFAKIAVTTAEVVHQLVNTARDISLPLNTLHDALLAGKLFATDERIGALITSLPHRAAYLSELTADFKKLGDPRHNNNCNLLHAAEQIESLFDFTFKDREITLNIDIASGITVSVPPLITVLALATLVGNSKDAVANGGRIMIKAWEEGEMIRCDVTDNGRGVSPEIQHRLFHERNVTTKNKGNGWGLYLVSRSLKDRQGTIELASSRPGETTFTIRLPKYNRVIKN
jgi:signal transduction histidine kinase